LANQLPSALSLCRIRGDTFPFTICLEINGAPLDITGFTIVLTVDELEEPPDNTTQISNRRVSSRTVRGAKWPSH
jgi:hypothetical protein